MIHQLACLILLLLVTNISGEFPVTYIDRFIAILFHYYW